MSRKMTDIDNQKLEDVMQSYMGRADGEALMQLIAALLETQLFIPVLSVDDQGGCQPCILKNPEGDLYLPAFTSIKKFPQDHTYEGMLKMPYTGCLSMLLDHPTSVIGITLNPYSDNLILKKQMLKLSREAEKDPSSAALAMAGNFHMVIRHQTEFHEIPERLYEQKTEFIRNLSAEALCAVYRESYVKAGQETQSAYTKDDFDLMELCVRDDLNIMQITLPAAQLYPTNCREIYIVWNPQTERIKYYAVEKGEEEEETDGLFFLTTVGEDGTQERLEEAPPEGSVIQRVMELFEAASEPEG